MSLHQQIRHVHRALRQPPSQQYFKEMDEVYNSKYLVLPLPIPDCNNSNLQGTALPTQSLSCKVPTTAFKHKQVEDREIKSNILWTDKTRTARALGYVNPAGATRTAAGCSTCQLASLSHPFGCTGAAAHLPNGQGAFSGGKRYCCMSDPTGCPLTCACCLRRGCMNKVTGKASIMVIWKFLQ